MITALDALLALMAGRVLFDVAAVLYGVDSRDGIADHHRR